MTVRFWQGLVHRANTPEEFDRFVRPEVDKLSNVIKVAGIRVEYPVISASAHAERNRIVDV